MSSNQLLACVAVLGALSLGSTSVDGAIVGFSDFSTYQASATGTETVIDFDTAGAGSAVGTMSGVTFNSSVGGLAVYATDNVSDQTISPLNYVGNSFVLFPELEDESITMTFDSPRSAAGIWVVYSGAIASSNFTLSGGGTTHNSSNADTTVGMVAGTQAHFLGLVDDTGANSISSITLQNPTGSNPYFFDSQTSFVASAIPEPSSLAFLSLIGGVLAVRRRRK